MRITGRIPFVVLLLALLAGCGGETVVDPSAESRSVEPSTTPPPASATAPQIRWKDADDQLLLKLKPKENGWKIYAPDDTVLGKAKVGDDRVKLKDAADVHQWKIKRKDGGARIDDAADVRIYKIVRDGDDWKLKRPDGETIVKFRWKSDGYEVRRADGATLAKVKVRGDQLVFKTEGGDRIGELEGVTDPLAGGWMAVDLFTLEQRAALVVFFLEVGV